MMPSSAPTLERRALRCAHAGRLRARVADIEAAVLSRVRELAPAQPAAALENASYEAGLRETVEVLVDFSLRGVEGGEGWSAEPPQIALAQAKRAAREGIGLATVLARYTAGHHVLSDEILQAAEDHPVSYVRGVLAVQGSLLERLLSVVSGAYNDEAERVRRTRRDERAHRVERLLAGEIVDADELGYELNAWHVAAIITGPKPEALADTLAARFEGDAIIVARADALAWVWLASVRKISPRQIADRVPADELERRSISLGEPGSGHAGFRNSHQQAQGAHRVALHRALPVVFYADVMLLSSALADGPLGEALEQVYIAPLRAAEKDCGDELLETLRTYVASERNTSSTANALRIHRHTVKRHLALIAQLIGRPLVECIAEVEVALRLDAARGGHGSR
jgi:DNA-binding PucR family transcriptional regulator